MKTIEQIRNYFTFELEKYSQKIIFSPEELYRPITYILSLDGKRTRPVLLLTACEMFGGNIKKALPAALSIELFHNFTLMHDDIMDKAPLRRNQKTVHQKWNENVAILSGDTLLVEAYKCLSKCENNFFSEVFSVFNNTAIDVCKGQQLDMNFETQKKVSVPDYIEMITLKTAVLIAASLKLGAITAGAKKADAEKMYEFGKNIGIAFQLQDDLLDVYGDEKKFGKKMGGDIVAHKKTILLITALENADNQTRNQLEKIVLLKNNSSAEKIRDVKKIYDLLNVKAVTEKHIQQYYKKAIKNIEAISLPNTQKEFLRTFAKNLMNREK
ncbi:MAG TPA: polyprenyl synthetase family protein [Bacteroidia bacterium]|nr:polyprenyl synthetase family protein [Bacteroidia bacterium]